MASSPPIIFSNSRRRAARERIRHLQQGPNPARFIAEDMVTDIVDRLGFLMHEPRRALVIGDYSGILSRELLSAGAEVIEADPARGFDEERPFPHQGFDFIASVSSLDTVNDLPGALIHVRRALSPGGLAIASFAGAGSLPVLRGIMFAADADRPAPRLHPQVDVRAGAQLLQRAGWADPVVDSRALSVSYRSFEQLVDDLRAQGLGNVLASSGPYLGKAGLARARAAFDEAADQNGKVVETFEIITLSGRHPGKGSG